MAVSGYDKSFMSDEDQKKLQEYTNAYTAAQATGDTAGMQVANEGANALRATYGYSGGGSGAGFSILDSSLLPGANKQTPKGYSTNDLINQQYDSYLQSQLAGLDADRSKIEPYYYGVKNQAAGQSAQDKAAFNEYAAANGLNSGAGGQAEIARQNVLAGNINSANVSQASAYAENDAARQQLAAEVGYQKNQALYNEYVRQLEAERAQNQFDAQMELQNRQLAADQSANEYSQNQTAKEQLADAGWQVISLGVMPSAEQLTAMGITSTQASGYIQATQSQQTAKKTSGSGTKKTTATKQTAAAATDYTVSDVAQSMKVNGDGANTKEVFDYIAENAASNDDFYNIAKNIGYSDYDIMIYLELRYGGTDNWQTIPS